MRQSVISDEANTEIIKLHNLLRARLKTHAVSRSVGSESYEVESSLHDLIISLRKKRTGDERFQLKVLSSIDAICLKIKEMSDTFNRIPKNEDTADQVNLSKELISISQKILLSLSQLSSDVIIKNKKPSEAIPVRLVTKTGKDFYNVETGGGGTFISDNKLSYGKGIIPITPISIGGSEECYTLPNGKKYLSVQNRGSSLVAFGATGLKFDESYVLVPRQGYEFIDCKDGFKVYFICDSGKTSTIVGFIR